MHDPVTAEPGDTLAALTAVRTRPAYRQAAQQLEDEITHLATADTAAEWVDAVAHSRRAGYPYG